MVGGDIAQNAIDKIKQESEEEEGANDEAVQKQKAKRTRKTKPVQ